ncbi:MAG: amino acid ABC transporter substrate-binding protein, partial [Desulfamplus sp.]|nr:amino acid ABC transporter substrate-binding protein [Desulfamplus sp.]
YTITSEPGPGTDFQLSLAEKYGREGKTANSHNYANGIMVAQVAVETIRRAKEKGLEITKKSLHDQLNAMNGENAYHPPTTVGPVTYSPTDRAGVDSLQIYVVNKGQFRKVGEPIMSEYVNRP